MALQTKYTRQSMQVKVTIAIYLLIGTAKQTSKEVSLRINGLINCAIYFNLWHNSLSLLTCMHISPKPCTDYMEIRN